MQDELVPIFAAATIDDAERLADKLAEAGIEAFVDAAEEPMHGMTRGPRSRVVHVRSLVCEHAKPVVHRYQQQWHEPLADDERPAEEPPLERSDEPRPSEDEAHGGVDHFTESMQLAADYPPPELRALHVRTARPQAERVGTVDEDARAAQRLATTGRPEARR